MAIASINANANANAKSADTPVVAVSKDDAGSARSVITAHDLGSASWRSLLDRARELHPALYRPAQLARVHGACAMKNTTADRLKIPAWLAWLARLAPSEMEPALALDLALVARAAQASDTVPPSPQQRPLLITGAARHTVSGPVLVGGRMLIERGRITAIAGAGEALPQPQRAAATRSRRDRRSLGGGHVYPGFIAASFAIGLTEFSAVRATVNHAEAGPINPNARAVVAVNADSGVLAALVVRGAGQRGLIAGTPPLIQLDGWKWEEMAIERRAALHVVLPSLRLTPQALEPLLGVLLLELRKFNRQQLQKVDDALFAAAAYQRARPNAPGSPPTIAGRRHQHACPVACIAGPGR